jgi:hypothetical protein
MSCYVMLRYVMLCYVMLCYVMLQYDVLLTFKNLASYIQDGRTATLQMLHFIYFFQEI